MPQLTNDLLVWLSTEWERTPAVILAGTCLQELLLVRPFDENNEALADALAELILVRRGYALAGYSAVGAEPRQAAERSGISATLHTGVHSNQPDLTAWLELYASVLAAAAVQAREAVAKLFGSDGTSALAAIPANVGPLRPRQRQALAFMAKQGAIRSGEYQKLAGIVPDTARRDFDELKSKGLIVVRGVGRATHYVLTQHGAAEAQRQS